MDPEGQPDPFEPENWAQNRVEPEKTGRVWQEKMSVFQVCSHEILIPDEDVKDVAKLYIPSNIITSVELIHSRVQAEISRANPSKKGSEPSAWHFNFREETNI